MSAIDRQHVEAHQKTGRPFAEEKNCRELSIYQTIPDDRVASILRGGRVTVRVLVVKK
jgi:hypothetical protein